LAENTVSDQRVRSVPLLALRRSEVARKDLEKAVHRNQHNYAVNEAHRGVLVSLGGFAKFMQPAPTQNKVCSDARVQPGNGC